MTPQDRKAELVRRQKTMAEIARSLGVTTTHVAQVVRGRHRSKRVEQAVADALGLPVEDVFDVGVAA